MCRKSIFSISEISSLLCKDSDGIENKKMETLHCWCTRRVILVTQRGPYIYIYICFSIRFKLHTTTLPCALIEPCARSFLKTNSESSPGRFPQVAIPSCRVSWAPERAVAPKRSLILFLFNLGAGPINLLLSVGAIGMTLAATAILCACVCQCVCVCVCVHCHGYTTSPHVSPPPHPNRDNVTLLLCHLRIRA